MKGPSRPKCQPWELGRNSGPVTATNAVRWAKEKKNIRSLADESGHGFTGTEYVQVPAMGTEQACTMSSGTSHCAASARAARHSGLTVANRPSQGERSTLDGIHWYISTSPRVP